jgi:hypothetical protein
MIGSQGYKPKRSWGSKARLTALLFLLSFPGCAGSSGRNVLVVAKTNSYHRENCARVGMAHTRTMTLEEARALNYEACPWCHPDSDH